MSQVHGLRNTLTAAGLIALMGVSVSRAGAQTTATASIDATAFVLGIAPLAATGVADLNFGSVTAGTTGTPAGTADWGRWDITGEPSAAVSIALTLPTELTGPGGGTIPISFGSGDGALMYTFPTVDAAFNPNAGTSTTLGAAGTLTVAIVGTVAPPVGTVTGTYTGTITLTVAYM
jgi:hypothetical protein